MYHDIFTKRINFKQAYNTPVYVFISNTNKCNANCIFCDVHTNPDKDSSILDWHSLFDDLVVNGTQFVHFMGGGEPFMDDRIWSYSRYLSSRNVRLVYTTNGYHIFDNGVRNLETCNIDTVFFSLDSHDAKIHDALRRTKGLWEKAVENILLLKQYKKDVVIVLNHVLNRWNIAEFSDFLLLKEKVPYDFINVITVKDCEELQIEIGQFKQFESNLEKYNQLLADQGIRLIGDGHLSELFSNNTEGYDMKCIYPWFSCYIDLPSGGVYPCDCTIHRDRDVYCCGNLLHNSFGEIWRSQKISRLRKSLYEDNLNCYEKCDLANRCSNMCIKSMYLEDLL